MMRRATIGGVAAALMLPLSALGANVDAAPGYPAKPVRFIVPFPPGAGTDITVRLVTTALSELWGKTMLVDNRSGAGGNIGTEITANAPGRRTWGHRAASMYWLKGEAG